MNIYEVVNLKFSVGDRVTVVPNIRQIEEYAGRDTSTQCLMISVRERYRGLRGVITEINPKRSFGGIARPIYRVSFLQHDDMWFHEEWICRDEEEPTMATTDCFDLDEMLSEF